MLYQFQMVNYNIKCKSMKKIILFVWAVLSLTACKDSSELYNYPYNKIGFTFKKLENRIFSKTFIYDKSTVTRDTVYIPMRTMGFVPKEDRPITVEQIQVTEEEVPGAFNAIPGVHYVPLDDPDWRKMAVAKGGKAEVLLPIILLRDASLADGQFALKLRIVENEVFKIVNPELAERIILTSDQLLRPARWDATFVRFFGAWGPVKHRFMLDNTSDKWDDEFIDYLMYEDASYYLYIRPYLRKKLEEENVKREQAGQGPLREPTINGVQGQIVVFP